MHSTSFVKRILSMGFLSVVLIAPVAQAQALPAGVHFGMTINELQAVQPEVQRVTKPQHLAGGLTGNWHGAPVVVAGLPFDLTFFFADSQLRRVEFLASTEPRTHLNATAFDALVAWGRSTFGPELGSSDPGGKYAAWVSGDVDVYAQSAIGPHQASVRLVYKEQQRKDGQSL